MIYVFYREPTRVLYKWPKLYKVFKYQLTCTHRVVIFKRREVHDLVVFLRYLVVPKDIESFLELCRSPWFPISDQELWEYQLHSKNDSNQEEEYEWSSQARDVLDQLGEYRSISLHLGYSEALKSLLINQHIVDFSHDHDATGRREANIWKFYSLLKNAERQPGFEMMQFLSSADFWIWKDPMLKVMLLRL